MSISLFRSFVVAACLFLHFAPNSSHAALPFTYDRRTKDYSSWTAAARGDINTIGMAGASLATASSIAAAEANPAGFAMQTSSLSAQINKTSFEEKRIQKSGELIESRQAGIGLSPYPWGFSLAYYSPMTENGDYLVPTGNGKSLRSEVSVKEFRLTVARMFFENKLAVGATLAMVKAVRELGEHSYNALGLTYRLGVLYHIWDHIVVGANYLPGVSIKPAGGSATDYELPGFNRRVVMPTQIGIGIGWTPNRFFKTGFSVTYVSPTLNTALLADQSIITGDKRTFVPRLGVSYVMAEYRNFKTEVAAGSYYEMSRLSGYPARLHGTAALEVNPYFINLGGGIDLATDYKNVMFTIGIDIVRTARTLRLIPQDPVPPYNGFFPKPHTFSADGLPPGLTKGEEQSFKAPDVGDVGTILKDIPKRVVEQVEKVAYPKEPSAEVEAPAVVKKKSVKKKRKTSVKKENSNADDSTNPKTI